jgi:hypothetical protein
MYFVLVVEKNCQLGKIHNISESVKLVESQVRGKWHSREMKQLLIAASLIAYV